jgi:tRNA threonylcarbamoyl adenosine modification protein (Sua5/YciO/YrdC/YwlC family)
MEIVKLSQKTVNQAVEFLNSGGVVIFPTDTVYGFLADAGNKKAVERIFKIKKRPKSKPLAVFVKDFKIANELAQINNDQKKIIKKYWPGKYTFVLQRKKEIKLFGLDKNTIALRVPNYKLLNILLKKINKPLVQTSVNISNNPAMTKIKDIIEEFNKKDIFVVDGGSLKNKKSSKITDLSKNHIEIIRS